MKLGGKIVFHYCRQINAIFSPHIHTAWEGSFSAALQTKERPPHAVSNDESYLLVQDFPSLSDPFHDTIPGDLKQSPCGASMEYMYAEKGPLTVEQLLGDQKLFKDGQSM